MISATKILRHTTILISSGFALCAMALPQTTAPNNPQIQKILQINPYYEQLSKLDWPVISTNKALKFSMQDSSIPAIRQRLQLLGDMPKSSNENDDTVFDASLDNGVKHFQWRHGLSTDGVIGPQTLEALNVSPAQRLSQLNLNLRRWENTPQLGREYVWINIPNYKLEVIQDGKTVLTMRVIVGKPDLPTPVISSHITSIVFNPPWNIPNSIIKKEIIPKVLQNPNYLAANNMRIYSNWEDNAQVLSPYRLPWQGLGKREDFPYRISQLPGKKNPLGEVKFVFENSEDVYMHDTPAKNLFNTPIRAYSHGCIRLEEPFKLVDFFRQEKAPNLSEGDVSNYLASNKTKTLPLKSSLPIYIGYITAWVDENNQPHFLEDIYRKDGIVISSSGK